MQCVAWSAPILPGKLEASKKFVEETNGPRLAEHDASRRRLGVVPQGSISSLMQEARRGEFVCVFHEADEPGRGLPGVRGVARPLRRMVPGQSCRAARSDPGDAAGTAARHAVRRLPRRRLTADRPRWGAGPRLAGQRRVRPAESVRPSHAPLAQVAARRLSDSGRSALTPACGQSNASLAPRRLTAAGCPAAGVAALRPCHTQCRDLCAACSIQLREDVCRDYLEREHQLPGELPVGEVGRDELGDLEPCHPRISGPRESVTLDR